MLILILIEMFFSLLDPFIVGRIIDSISSKSVDIYKYILLLTFLFILTIIIYRIESIYLLKITARIEKKIKLDIFSQILMFSYKDTINIDKGLLINNIEEDGMIASNIFNELLNFIKCVVSIVIILVIMLTMNIGLSAIVLLFVPIEAIIFILMGKLIKNRLKELMELKDRYMNFINDSLNALKIFKIFNIGNKRNEKFEVLTNDVYTAAVNKKKMEIDMYIVVDFISFISSILILLIGSILCLKNIITIGTLVSFNSYASKFKLESNNLSNFNALIQDISVSLERIENIYSNYKIDEISTISIIDDRNTNINSIELNNVSFSYTEDISVINDFSFKFEKGNIYKIVGESGKGKSTFFDILAGLYPELSDRFIINESEKFDFNNYKNNLVYIDQNSYIFTDSIYENISLYRNIEQKIVEKVCKTLDLDKVIDSLSNKYNTVINKESNLSGGQKQRILIARAFVEKKEVYIFDEITSALDYENKKRFYKLIEKIKDDSIIIFASHEEEAFKGFDVKKIYL
ncbi:MULTISPECIES: ABC transporter transmembrane domain-containing protein [Peptostreptococcales]|uniref:ABC transporter transmembrane domain-containing protein n=1 Tax=Peptostreptococcales TaxID=3082720 RepID=UPI0011C38D2C|nr:MULTISPECIES: ABC transporter ATP-binding protein [Peptostreptococcaceae]MEE0249401.1 ABC transporter ATP-binding protein [Peptacetobacter hiranonis]QQQ86646.1 ABC transporter ATP-binding protein [Peptacetobacter hiranonis]